MFLRLRSNLICVIFFFFFCMYCSATCRMLQFIWSHFIRTSPWIDLPFAEVLKQKKCAHVWLAALARQTLQRQHRYRSDSTRGIGTIERPKRFPKTQYPTGSLLALCFCRVTGRLNSEHVMNAIIKPTTPIPILRISTPAGSTSIIPPQRSDDLATVDFKSL